MSSETIRRALEMADSGAFSNTHDLRRALTKEGCDVVDAHFSGLSFKTQLNARIGAARLKNKRGT